MSRTRGKRFETSLCSDIYDETGGTVIAEPIGYSGNHNVPAPDIRIDDGTKVHAIELKTTDSDRVSVTYDPTDRARDDIAQLLEYAHTYPRTVAPYIGIKFTHRQLLLAKLWLGAPNDQVAVRSATKTVPTDVRYTYKGNLSFHRPDTNDWPSEQAGDNVDYLLRTIGYR